MDTIYRRFAMRAFTFKGGETKMEWLELLQECGELIAFCYILAGVLFGLAIHQMRARERHIERAQAEIMRERARLAREAEKLSREV